MNLVADALACRRAGRLVFEGVSFRLAAGEVAVLRGPNGSGKSSLLRLLAGLTPAAAGTARLGTARLDEARLDEARLDEVTLTDGEAWRERVALGGHLDAVKPALTVRENLLAWAAFHGRPAAAVDAALERFGLSALAHDPAQWCSAGQKRRLGLARLPVIGRPLWLLDEPTVSLDTASAEVFAEVVRAHVVAGGLAIAATHVALNLGETVEVRLPGRASPEAGDLKRLAATDRGGPEPRGEGTPEATGDGAPEALGDTAPEATDGRATQAKDARAPRGGAADPFLSGDWR